MKVLLGEQEVHLKASTATSHAIDLHHGGDHPDHDRRYAVVGEEDERGAREAGVPQGLMGKDDRLLEVDRG